MTSTMWIKAYSTVYEYRQVEDLCTLENVFTVWKKKPWKQVLDKTCTRPWKLKAHINKCLTAQTQVDPNWFHKK